MLNRHLCLRLWTAAAVAAALASTASAQKAVQLRLIPSGFSDKLGQYKPVAVTLSTGTPESVKKLPADLKNTKFGVLPFTTSTGNPATIAVGERDGRSYLFIDANTNGDLTDDREPKWQQKEVRGEDAHVFKHYYGTVELPLATAAGAPPVQLGLYLFDPADPARAEHKDKLFCYSDFGYEGGILLGGATYRAALMDEAASGLFTCTGERGSATVLFVDADSDGRFGLESERFDVRRSFALAGGVFQMADLTPGGEQFVLKVIRPAADKSPPTETAAKFEAKTMDGKPVRFPADYKGKIVLLDFWATWCRPCMMEVPNVVVAYERFHKAGFEILGVSLDKEKAEDRIRQVLTQNHMDWPQIYDGKFWNAAQAVQYGVRSIPHAILVDGDTGAVLGKGNDLRGPNLARAIEAALKKKNGIEK